MLLLTRGIGSGGGGGVNKIQAKCAENVKG